MTAGRRVDETGTARAALSSAPRRHTGEEETAHFRDRARHGPVEPDRRMRLFSGSEKEVGTGGGGIQRKKEGETSPEQHKG